MLRTLVNDYPAIHTGIGIAGNLMFFAGSILFFERFSAWKTAAVWLFVVGSAAMLVGAVGNALVKYYDATDEGAS